MSSEAPVLRAQPFANSRQISSNTTLKSSTIGIQPVKSSQFSKFIKPARIHPQLLKTIKPRRILSIPTPCPRFKTGIKIPSKFSRARAENAPFVSRLISTPIFHKPTSTSISSSSMTPTLSTTFLSPPLSRLVPLLSPFRASSEAVEESTLHKPSTHSSDDIVPISKGKSPTFMLPQSLSPSKSCTSMT